MSDLEVMPPSVQDALEFVRGRPLETRLAVARDLITDGERAMPIMRYFTRWKQLAELGREVFDVEPPRRKYLIEEPGLNDEGERWTGIMPLGKVAMLASAGGSGKTMAAMELALAVATGTDWLNKYRTPNPGHVLVVLGEEDEEEVRRRLYYAGRVMRLTPAQVEQAMQHITVMAMEGEDVALLDNEHRPAEFLTWLQMELREPKVEWKLLVLDPLSRFASGDTEVDNHAATKFVRAVESLLQVPGRPTVLLTHHTNKNARKDDKAKASASDARGASGLTDGARWVANLSPSRDGEDLVLLEFTKSNYTARGQRTELVREYGGGALRVETQAERHMREQKQAEAEAAKSQATDAKLPETTQSSSPAPSAKTASVDGAKKPSQQELAGTTRGRTKNDIYK
jgi:RecA-family ATPase